MHAAKLHRLVAMVSQGTPGTLNVSSDKVSVDSAFGCSSHSCRENDKHTCCVLLVVLVVLHAGAVLLASLGEEVTAPCMFIRVLALHVGALLLVMTAAAATRRLLHLTQVKSMLF
jgi:hypothetical protein